MPNIRPILRALARSDSGVTALEYGLIVALIGVAAISAMYGVGDSVGRNLDIVVAAVADKPALEGDPTTSGDGEGGTAPNPAGPAAATANNDSASSNNGNGGNATSTAGDSSSGEDTVGSGAGGTNSNDSAAASPANGAGAGNSGGATGNSAGGAGHSGGGASNFGGRPGGGSGGAQVAVPNPSGTGEASALFGRDSTFQGDAPGDASRGSAPWAGSAAIGPGTATGASSQNRSTRRTKKNGDESATKSALILLLWLILAFGAVVLGWKMALRAAAQKNAEEEMEDWKPASFGEDRVAAARLVH